ncbi:MAG: bifunctional DNA primase/polymerase [Rhodomicrobium sp.]
MLPEVMVSKKGRRGFTVFFRSSIPLASRRFRSVERKILVEILAMGRQTVLPPTIHPDTKEPYQWLTQATLFNTRVEDLPLTPDNIADIIETALAKWIEKPENRVDDGLAQSTVHASDLSEFERKRYAAVCALALKAWAEELAATPQGSRNDTLYRAVCRLGQFVHYGFVDKPTLECELLAACKRNGLTHDIGLGAVNLTISSGLKKSKTDQLRALKDRPFTGGERPKSEPKTANAGDAWPEPHPLPNGLPWVASFDFMLLPEKVRGRVDDIATTMQSSPDYAGVATMIGLGSVIGPKDWH